MNAIYELIDDHDWEGVRNFFRRLPGASRERRPNGNSALHEVCKRQPPISVIDVLLEAHEDAIRWHGEYGYLPLHFACTSGASFEVVTRLLEIYPAATRCRDDLEDALPIHLAAKWGASEDVVMEILTAHPEGSFMKDALGKTPIEYAEALPEGDVRKYAINALSTAPVLISTAKAASERVQWEWETKINGVNQAHTEFVRQLEERHEEEISSFLQLEVQFKNELAEEKERSIALAEALVDAKAKVEEVRAERDEARIRLAKEQAEHTFEAEKKMAIMEKNHNYNIDMVKHLNELLSSKDEKLKQVTNELSRKEDAQRKVAQLSDQLATLQKGTQLQLESAAKDKTQLKELTENQQRQLSQMKRMLEVQESRLGSIKSLVASLSYNIESWSMDDEEWDQKTFITKASTFLEGLEAVAVKDSARELTNAASSSTAHDKDKWTTATASLTLSEGEDASPLSQTLNQGRMSINRY